MKAGTKDIDLLEAAGAAARAALVTQKKEGIVVLCNQSITKKTNRERYKKGKVAPLAGVEPATIGLKGRCSTN